MHAVHARQSARAPLAVSLALSVVMHVAVAGGVVTVFAVRKALSVFMPSSTADKQYAEAPPASDSLVAAAEPENVIWVQPGIDSSSGDATAWIGYDEASEHHAAVSTVDQSAMTPDLPGMMGDTPSIAPPAPPAPPSTPSPPAPPLPSPVPSSTPAPSMSEPPPEAPTLEPTSDPTSAPPSVPPVDPSATEPPPAPSPATSPAEPPRPRWEYTRAPELERVPEPEPEKAPADPKQDVSPDRDPAIPLIGPPSPEQLVPTQPVVDAPVRPAPTSSPMVIEAAGPPVAGERVTPAPTPTPSTPAASPVPPAAPPAPRPAGNPGEQADKEADATSIKQAVDYRLGRVHAGEGLDIKTVKPEFSNFTVLTALPRHPVVEITFTTAGKVKNVRMLQSSGYQDVDEPILNAVWAWTVSGKKLNAIARENPTALIKISVRMLL